MFIRRSIPSGSTYFGNVDNGSATIKIPSASANDAFGSSSYLAKNTWVWWEYTTSSPTVSAFSWAYGSGSNVDNNAERLTVLFSGNSAIFSITRPSNSAWHGHAIAYDASNTTNVPTWKLDYVGQSVTTVQTPTGSFNGLGSTSLYIGNRNFLDRGFHGYVSQFQWFNRILSDGEMDLALRYPGSITSSLLIYQPLNANDLLSLAAQDYRCVVPQGGIRSSSLSPPCFPSIPSIRRGMWGSAPASAGTVYGSEVTPWAVWI